jgi:hypothetical protein
MLDFLSLIIDTVGDFLYSSKMIRKRLGYDSYAKSVPLRLFLQDLYA